MKINEILIDPQTGEELEEVDGSYKSSSNKYTILKEIPLFEENENFDGHWEDNATDDIPEAKLDAARRFLAPLITYQKEKKRKLHVLDAGCGDGMHILTLENHPEITQNGSEILGLDLSLEALNVARSRSKKQHSFVQGDVSKLPFKSESFEVVISYGVLAYTPNPGESFESLTRVLKSGGLIGIWVYPKRTGVGGFVFNTIRGFCRLTGKGGTNFIANLIVPFLGLLPTTSRLSLKNASWKQCREIVKVNIAPEQLYFPQKEEVYKWFDDNGIELVNSEDQDEITLWGIKK